MSETTPAKKGLQPAAVGIRLGSSTLTLAVARLGEGFDPRPSVVAGDSGERTTPAVVARANGEWVLGEAANLQAAKNPKNTFKGLLTLTAGGTSEKSAAKHLKGISWSEGDGGLQLQPVDPHTGESDGEAVIPQALLSMLLRRLKEIAEENVGGAGKVGPCVLTCPPHYTETQREAVRSAGQAAGFDVLQVISQLMNAEVLGTSPVFSSFPSTFNTYKVLSDSTAAALAYGVDSAVGGPATPPTANAAPPPPPDSSAGVVLPSSGGAKR
jgi:molecular chaperone DnaK (HSP70)